MRKNWLSSFLVMWLFSVFSLAQVREIPSPAGANSAQPNLTVAPNARVYLSWIEKKGDGLFSLRFSVKEKDGWSRPHVIAEGANWFVNWADFPSMIILPDGSLAAHWLVKSAPGSFDYNVTISRSFDGGKSWSKPFIPHQDEVKAEHGFVSLLPTKDGSLGAIWLDGREMQPAKDSHDHGHGNMTLRYVKIKRDGKLVDEAVLDAKVCECCQTSAAMTADGAVAVYRDRSDEEVRDISIVKFRNGKWSAPQTLFSDNWKINGCPVNGPSIAANGRRVAVAWYTAVNNQPHVKLTFSNNSGANFTAPIVVDDGNPIGRVETLLLDDGSALVVWLEKLSEGGAVKMRRIKPDGTREESITIAPSGTARSNGFPQIVRSGKTLVFAWTGKGVQTATVQIP